MKEKNFFAHESSYIDEGAVIGKGTKIGHFSHVMGGAVIGERCIIGENVSVCDRVTIEDEVFVGPSVVFTNAADPGSLAAREKERAEIRIKKGAALGANCTIAGEVTVGAHAFVEAGSVVIKDVPAHAVVAALLSK